MKPLKLTISGFGPFAGETAIDFTALGARGLYLITGETGAGKTTIFDAVSYALYGQTSGRTRTGEMLRSHFAAPETKTYIELVFEYKNLIYRVKRSPEYERPKLKGEGFTKESASAELYLPGGGFFDKADVTAKIEEITGLTREQFSQIVMLAQGDFMRFLHSDTDDRTKILRRIFNTARYESFQNALRENMRSYKSEYEGLKDRFSLYASNVSHDGSGGFPPGNINNAPEFMDFLAGLIKNQETTAENLRAEYEFKAGKYNILVRRINEAAEVNRKFEELKEKNNEYAELFSKSDECEELKARIAAYDAAALKVKPLDEVCAAAEADYKRQQISLKEAERLTEALAAEFGTRKSAYEKECEKETARTGLAERIARIREAQPSYEQRARLESELAEAIIKAGEYVKVLTGLKTSASVKEEAKTNAEAELTRVKDEYNALSEGMPPENISEGLPDKLRALLSEISGLEERIKKLSEYQNGYIIAEEKFTTANAEFAEADKAFFREQAGIIAQNLEPDAPCPVCGSKDHPMPALLAESAPSEAEVEKLRSAMESARSERDRLGLACGTEKSAVEANKNYIAKTIGSEVTDLTLLREQIRLRRDGALKVLNAVKTLESLTEQYEEIKRGISASEEAYNAVISEKTVLEARISDFSARLDYANIDEAKSALSSGEKEYDSLTASFEKAKKEYESINAEYIKQQSVTAERSAANAEYDRRRIAERNKFLSAVVENGFPSVLEYRTVLSYKTRIGEWKEYLSEYYSRIELLKHDINRLGMDTNGKTYVDLSAMTEEESELSAVIESNRAVYTSLAFSAKSNAELYIKLKDTLSEAAEKEKRYAECKALSDTANGDITGKIRITFETYVQSAYFSRILHAANVRLDIMSGGRYRLIRRDEIKTKQKKSGLDIDVLDAHTGKSRDVKSLSGGESFKASLSLALGLSDVVQASAGGIALDAMFIDEGFGSLDSESLDSAVSALQTIASNRIIGIISHVGELNARIEKQIVVAREINGSSVSVVV